MPPLTVDASFFWIMVLVAFAAGVFVQRKISERESSEERRATCEAVEMLSRVSTHLRSIGKPLPTAMHKRICDLRVRIGG